MHFATKCEQPFSIFHQAFRTSNILHLFQIKETEKPVLHQILDFSARLLTILPARIILKFCEAMQNVSINNDDE